MNVARWVCLASVWAFVGACSGGGGQPSTTCTPGATQACTCTSGQSGAQTCNADGTFGACECTAPIDAPRPVDSRSIDAYVPRLGVDWTHAVTSAPFGQITNPVLAELAGELWLLSASAWHSPDGTTWTAEAGTLAFVPECAASWNGALWVFGNNASLYSTTDGVHFTSVIASGGAFGPRNATASCFVFNSELWIGGAGGTLYHSADGTTWNLASNLDDGAAIVVPYQNALWQFGRTTSGSYVKSSTDGVSWTSVNLSAPFSEALYGRAAVAGNKMWLVVLGTGANDAVWSTTTGLDFVDVQAAPPFGMREYSGLVAFDPSGTMPRLWLVGGYVGSNAYADIWVSP